jgi:hypothetical protein
MVAGATACADANSGRATAAAAMDELMNLYMMKNLKEALSVIFSLIGEA